MGLGEFLADKLPASIPVQDALHTFIRISRRRISSPGSDGRLHPSRADGRGDRGQPHRSSTHLAKTAAARVNIAEPCELDAGAGEGHRPGRVFRGSSIRCSPARTRPVPVAAGLAAAEVAAFPRARMAVLHGRDGGLAVGAAIAAPIPDSARRSRRRPSVASPPVAFPPVVRRCSKSATRK